MSNETSRALLIGALSPCRRDIRQPRVFSPRAHLVIVGTADGNLHWINVKSGEVKKRVQLGGMPYGTPVTSESLLFVLVSMGKSRLVALDAATGAVRWEQETPKEWTTYRPLVADSVVIVGDDDKNLCAFDRATGVRRWCRPVGETPRGLGISRDGILYVGSLSGIVQVFRLSSADKR
jgi:outer membrane protein assembly factor BamB